MTISFPSNGFLALDALEKAAHFSVSPTTASASAPASAALFFSASFSFSSLILVNFFMFSSKSGPLYKVMNSLAFLLLSPLDPWTVMVLVLISLKVAYLFLTRFSEAITLVDTAFPRAWSSMVSCISRYLLPRKT